MAKAEFLEIKQVNQVLGTPKWSDGVKDNFYYRRNKIGLVARSVKILARIIRLQRRN